MSEAPPLLSEVDAFIERVGISPVTFGRKAMKDPHFVAQLRAGRRTFRETEAKVRAFMAKFPTEEVRAA